MPKTKKYQYQNIHHCTLGCEADELLNSFICTGLFIHTRRKLKKCFMVNSKHPLTKYYIRSSSQFKREEARHLTANYNMIHPFSMFSFAFRIYMFFILCFTYIWWPIIAAHWPPELTNNVYTVSYISYLVLIILSFYSGYYEKENNVVVLSSKEVARSYLTSYFVFDIVSIMPYFLRILTWQNKWNSDNIYIRNLKWILPLFAYARYLYFLDTLHQIKLYLELNVYVYSGIRCVINLMVTILGLNLVVYYLLIEVPEFKDRPPFASAMSTFEVLMMISHGLHVSDHIIDKLCPVFLILYGFFVQLLLYVVAYQLWYQFSSTRNQQQKAYASIEAYMAHKALPLELRNRIFLYLNFKFQRKFYKESSISKITPSVLKKEILIALSRNSIFEVELFKDIPMDGLTSLRANLIYLIFLPGDVIIEAGTTGNSMFFILTGTVTVTAVNGTEICRLKDGTHFGEIALMINIVRLIPEVYLAVNMEYRRQDTKYHKCELQDEPDDVVKAFIDTGIFIKIRRRIKRLMMISQQHPLTRFYIKSLYMLRKEEQRHLIKYYYMIHPLSMFAFGYRIFMAIHLFVHYFVWPVITPYWSPIQINYLLLPIYPSYVVLIVLSFFTGYADKTVHTIVLNPKRVTNVYLKSHFVIDVICVTPFIFRMLLYKGILSTEDQYARIFRWILPLMTYFRYYYFLETLNQVRLYIGLSNYIFRIIRSIINFTSFLMMLNLIVYYNLREVPAYRNISPKDSTVSVLEVVMLVGHGLHNSELLSDKIIPIFLILFGFIVHLLIFVYAMEIWYKFLSCENKQNTVYDAVEAFIKYKALPAEKRHRIFLCLNFKYQRRYYKESTIVRITSDTLRREVLVEISKESTKKVFLFKELPESILEKLRANFTCEIYLPSDVIIQAGKLGRCMFFILAGTVVIKTPKGRVVRYLRDGDHFGEISLVVNVARVATVMAVTPCQLFRLNREQFLRVVRHYPDLLKHIHVQALKRIADMSLHTDGAEMTDNGSADRS
ncbi:uncharacterized protein LOC115881859 [Sitophilus oryzae]|uniref:Uncharacterized protein LOC115881859 n=1 Tax=Sitophilus oryzae TaxID=7048 RepID=A0A6J2XWG3_SITOR|nr:uncharacterized protein LOC115881859 [Sitophilus oryzae]